MTSLPWITLNYYQNQIQVQTKTILFSFIYPLISTKCITKLPPKTNHIKNQKTTTFPPSALTLSKTIRVSKAHSQCCLFVCCYCCGQKHRKKKEIIKQRTVQLNRNFPIFFIASTHIYFRPSVSFSPNLYSIMFIFNLLTNYNKYYI